MKALKIIEANPRRGMFMVCTDANTYTVFELNDFGSLTVGDVLKADWEDEGHQTAYPADGGLPISIVVQNVGCTLAHARNRMLY